MKQVKATIKIGSLFDKPIQEHKIDTTEFDSIEEAISMLGPVIVLKHINYAQRLIEMAMARRKFIAIHEAPEKARLEMRRKAWKDGSKI